MTSTFTEGLDAFVVACTTFKPYLTNLETELKNKIINVDNSEDFDRSKIYESCFSKFKESVKELCDIVNSAESSNMEIVHFHKEELESNIDDVNTNKTQTEIKSWADEPLKSDGSVAWVEVVKKNKKPKAIKSSSVFESSVFTEDGRKWYNLRVPVEEVNVSSSKSNLTVPLIVVENYEQYKSLPLGIMVYNKSLRVPKVQVTMRKNIIQVPLDCRIWNYNDEQTMSKFSRYNSDIVNDRSPSIESFYIDEEVSKTFKVPEDKFRVFRHPQRSRSGQVWSGYGIKKPFNFGDSSLLYSHVKDVSTKEAIDLYQYSLWMVLVGIVHNSYSS